MSRNQEYVEQYAEYAMEQMRRYGIPASVTLAQGICESASGQSKLSRKGNNHFGIKATSGWVQNGGKYLVYTDDRPNEKFCQYASVGDSYEHHSQFLKGNKRYSSLFKLSPDDYKGWTNGLQNSGYASNKKYASSLQSIIEKNNLQKYDQMVMKEMKSQGKSFGTETNPRQQGEQTSQKTSVSKPAESEKYSYPLKRNEFMLVTSPFGMRKDPLNPANTQMHKGIDIQARHDNVLATEDKGKVTRVNNNPNTAGGLSVTVEYNRNDGSKYQCTYMHLSSIAVKAGDNVNAGQRLGVTGNTGTRTTGEHLHFGVKSISADGKARDIDPAAYLAEISQKGNIQLQTLHNGKDITAQYKVSNPASQGEVQDMAQSPEAWMKKLLSSEDSGVKMPGEDPVIEMAMTMFTSLMALALQIDNKSEEEKMQNVTDSVVSKSIDLSSLLPSYKACSVNIQEGKPYLHVDNGTVQFTRELTQAEMMKLQQTLGNANLSDEDKRRGVVSIIQAAIVSQQMSQNYQKGVDNQQDRQESVQIK
ncbi:peptidoglycan DD-metalloendopeptidase family protein [Prevotella copri]|uniref:Peptidoglycan DD-metalloendopeptidase family protein n=1 Tax=Segatella copri TaxID=165179 RepID=A0A6A7VLN8_9BACT|nr:glucosaminidase domain-containing protein [Segatella copri]MQN63818.1 peptidoglycan DD-metalloendopeptidase family protein [Segatella copri]MQO55518.1 peptidoglycan DD-metalloendopeptidase family protein [Segatella copri]MQO95706.1 peptidoglycan DD-metalloendopeptidase family protein [Segatella copri]